MLNATPWPLTPEKRSGTHCIGLDIGLVWTAEENLEQARIQSADSPACSESLFLWRQYGSLEEKREGSEKSDRQHTVSPGFQICYSDQTVTHTHTHTHTHTPFFHFCTRWVGVLNATLPQNRNQVPIVLGGTQGRSGQLQKISCKLGFKPQTVQLVVSHCSYAGSMVH